MPRFSGLVAFEVPTWPGFTDKSVCPKRLILTSSASTEQVSRMVTTQLGYGLPTIWCALRREERIPLLGECPFCAHDGDWRIAQFRWIVSKCQRRAKRPLRASVQVEETAMMMSRTSMYASVSLGSPRRKLQEVYSYPGDNNCIATENCRFGRMDVGIQVGGRGGVLYGCGLANSGGWSARDGWESPPRRSSFTSRNQSRADPRFSH